jgi:hypothetical protein
MATGSSEVCSVGSTKPEIATIQDLKSRKNEDELFNDFLKSMAQTKETSEE